MRPIVRLAGAIVAAAVTVAVLVGIPAALATAVGWPLPTSWPALSGLPDLARAGVSDTAVINTLAVIVWVAWAQLALAIIVEAAAAARGRTARRLPLLPGIQPLAARLIAGIVLTAVLTQPRPAAGVSLEAMLESAPASTTVTDPPTRTPATRPPAAAPTGADASGVTVTVGPRDTWWSLAERHLGDGLRWQELRHHNLDRQVAPGTLITANTDHLDAGWQLTVPTTPARHDHASGEVTEADDPLMWEVAPGDSFWTITRRTLTDAWGRTPTDAEIAPYWQQIVDTNRHQLAPPNDPDLIRPGERYQLRPPPDDPTSAAPAEVEPADSDQPDAPDQHPADDPTTSDGDSISLRPDAPQAEAGEPVAPPADDATTGDESAAGRGWQAALEPAPDPAYDPQPGSSESTLGPVLLPGIAAAGLAAAGLLVLARRRRRLALQQRPAGLRLPTLAPDTQVELARAEAAAPATSTLDDLASLLTSLPPGVDPALATLTDHRDLALLFDGDVELPEPPSPWQHRPDPGAGPIVWHAQVGAVGPSRSVGLPLLVTLGQTDTATVLANLGTIGTLHVNGPAEPVRRWLRTITLEVALSRTAGPVEVSVAGDERLHPVEEVRHGELHAPLTAALAERDDEILIDDRTARLLVCHPDATPVQVPAGGIDGLVGQIVAGGDQPSADSWQLTISGQDTAILTLPDGGLVTLTLPALDPTPIVDDLDRLTADPDEPNASVDDDLTTVPAGAAAPGSPSSNSHQPAVATPIVPAWCEVRLLGPVEVVRDGQQLHLSPLPMQVLLYLITHRDGVSAERLDDAIWNGHAAPPSSQRLRAATTKLRDQLGAGPDGQPLLPRRQAPTANITLSDHVGSDLDRTLAHLARARHLPDLRAADEIAAGLSLVRGEPLEGLPLSWATDVSQHALASLQDAGLHAAGIYRQAGRHDDAGALIERTLRLGDPYEPLYVEWARLEADRGRHDHIAQLWRRLQARYADDADEVTSWIGEPSADTHAAFQALLASR